MRLLRILTLLLLSSIQMLGSIWVPGRNGGYYLIEENKVFRVNTERSSIVLLGTLNENDLRLFHTAKEKFIHNGKLYLSFDGKAVVYDPKENSSWQFMSPAGNGPVHFIASGENVFMRSGDLREIKLNTDASTAKSWYESSPGRTWGFLFWLIPLILLFSGAAFYYLKRNRRVLHTKDPAEAFFQNLELREHTLLKDLLKTSIRGQPYTTERLIELLDLKGKSNENQRKWRNVIIKSINTKANDLLLIDPMIDRQRNPNDQREVWYMLSPMAIELLRDSLHFMESPGLKSYS